MKTKLILVPVALIISSIFFLGCFGVDNEFSEIKDDVVSTAGIHFYKDIEFGIGSAGLSFASAVVDISSNDNDAREIIKHISKVQVGVYKNAEKVSRQAAIKILGKIDDKLSSHGWDYIVKSYDGSELSSVYIKNDGESKLWEMFVVNLSDDELTIVDVKGNLEKILSYVIKDRRMGICLNN